MEAKLEGNQKIEKYTENKAKNKKLEMEKSDQNKMEIEC